MAERKAPYQCLDRLDLQRCLSLPLWCQQFYDTDHDLYFCPIDGMEKTDRKENGGDGMILNFVAIVLAITGILNPVVGALVHNCGSVFVIINSAFLLSYHYQKA